MLYGSLAVVRAFIILCNMGLNPEVLDLDIPPITTTMAMTVSYAAIKEYCKAFRVRRVLCNCGIFARRLVQYCVPLRRGIRNLDGTEEGVLRWPVGEPIRQEGK